MNAKTLGVGFWLALATTSALAALSTNATAMPWDVGGAVAPAQTPATSGPDPLCAESYANDKKKSGPAIRFGVQPRLAGEAGATQTTALTPESDLKRDAALGKLRGNRKLVLRLNRLMAEDGQAGIEKFRKLAEHFAAKGYEINLQLRYHPADRDNGNIAKWLSFVKKAVKAVGPNELVTDIQVTNEVNIAVSKNTSDGYYKNSTDALVQGMITASKTSKKYGFDHQRFGFDYLWRTHDGTTDAAFWNEIGEKGGEALRSATDWVGVHMYPGTYMPGLFFQEVVVTDLGDSLLEGLAQVRECYMPKAGLRSTVPIHIKELAMPTGPGRTETEQATALSTFVKVLNDYRGTYNVADVEWFNLRDNNSAGPDFHSYFGLLRDDYSPKPSFDVFRRLIKTYGAKRKN